MKWHEHDYTLLLLFGFAFLIWARVDQTRGVTTGGDDFEFIDIKEKESPFGFWLYVVTYYAAGIFFIVCAVIAFFAPNPLF